MTYQDIITKIKSVLEDEETGVSELKAVYEGFPDSGLTVFPCATIMPQGRMDDFLDTRDTRRLYTIIIRVCGNTEHTGVNTQKVVWALADSVSNVLEKNITLDGTVDWVRPIQDKFMWDSANSKIYFNEMQVNVNTRFNRLA